WDPEAGETEAGEPEGWDPEAGEPEAGEPEGWDPEGWDQEAGDPEAGETEGWEPEDWDPEAGEPEDQAGIRPPVPGQTAEGRPAAGPECGEVICPSCLKSFQPGSSGWTACPRCGEKFLARPAALWPLPEEAPPPGAFRKRRPWRARKVTYAGDNVRQVYEIGIAENELPLKRKFALAALAAGVLFLVFYGRLLVSSWQSAGELIDPVVHPRTATVSQAYGQSSFEQDVVSFFRWTRGRHLNDYPIDRSSISSRLFKYAVARLAPDECQEFTSLTLNSLAAGQPLGPGVRIIGQCYNSALEDPQVLVRWSGREALLSVPAKTEVLSVTLFSQLKEPAEEPGLLPADQGYQP
ncbi:MAG: hypothetical protein LBK52_07780, partial [Deltaproteobacteria bacterium]|nr:hypothetical protein [Deltaproteobacteria bacterium]